MSCFVGRNGEGKSSLIDFLRDSFILILENTVTHKIEFESDGKLSLSAEDLLYYHLEKETGFLVIFSLDDNDYYVTNLNISTKPDKCVNIKDADITDISKIRLAWFSAMRFPFDVSRSELYRDRSESLSSGKDSFEKILTTHIINLAEESMNEMRTDTLSRLNWDVLMQTAFFAGNEKDPLEEIIGKGGFEKIQIDSAEFGRETFTVKALISEAEKGNTSHLEEAITDARAYLRPFSSGQYSRFSFLARLYWCLGGGEAFCHSEVGKKMKGILDAKDEQWLERYMFGRSDTPVLLMDESDLYYHPEWQRVYINDILEMVDKCVNKDKKVQIIFTTNSAFMLSDMLKEDVVVLSPEGGNSDLVDRTFGQNIHMLLARPFFMKSTIGASAEKKIIWLLGLLKSQDIGSVEKEIKKEYSAWFEAYKKETGEDISADEFLKRLIDSIGEEFIRHRLVYLYEEYMKEKREKKTNLENALAYLEAITDKDDNVKTAIEKIKKAGEEA